MITRVDTSMNKSSRILSRKYENLWTKPKQCQSIVLNIQVHVFGHVDWVKFELCLTLHVVDTRQSLFICNFLLQMIRRAYLLRSHLLSPLPPARQHKRKGPHVLLLVPLQGRLSVTRRASSRRVMTMPWRVEVLLTKLYGAPEIIRGLNLGPYL